MNNIDDPFEVANYINNVQSYWKADPKSPFANLSYLRQNLGVLPDPDNTTLSMKEQSLNLVYLPKSFDSREKWPNCESIGKIKDQGGCGSCWAVGAANTMTDRFCIHSNGTTKPSISSQDLLTCCGSDCHINCQGGYVIKAWNYWVKNGIVTGGDYDTFSGCKDYSFPKCDHTGRGLSIQYPICREVTQRLTCSKECQKSYNKNYENDKYFGINAYIVPNREEDIMLEIFTNGPVEAVFMVYEDFGLYNNGIYKHLAGGYAGGHAVRIIGWGIDNGNKYWLVANSWNEYWGERGFFRIAKGENECQIESGVLAGIPNFKNSGLSYTVCKPMMFILPFVIFSITILFDH